MDLRSPLHNILRTVLGLVAMLAGPGCPDEYTIPPPDAYVPDAEILCGNGSLQRGEACDDQNRVGGDGCDSDCRLERGFVCQAVPTVCASICGNSQVNVGENCDDGNLDPGDGCDPFCRSETGFACGGSPSTCAPHCGDGLLVFGEECDDQNTVGGDGCSDTCAVEPNFACAGQPSECAGGCGNGQAAGVEACDDGNDVAGDGCTPHCQVEPGWACQLHPSVCTEGCGDGTLAGSESCDDGNNVGGDGCSGICRVEPGWNCGGSPSTCDPFCGDGLVRGSEGCDDAATVDGDGCSAACAVEAGYTCHGEPSICTDHCTSDDQCSAICNLETHTCVAESDVVYVDCGASCPGVGTQGMPYCTIQSAVDHYPLRDFILVLPSVCTDPVEIDTEGLTLVGQPGAALQSPSCPALFVHGTTTVIRGLTIQGESDSNGGGIRVDSGAEVTMTDVTIGPSYCIGVDCDGAAVCRVLRSRIVDNFGGGVRVKGSGFVLQNNVIVQNGNGWQATWGGAWLEPPTDGPAEFVNNTVADNDTIYEDGNTGGIHCHTPVTLLNSILWENELAEASDECSVLYANISQTDFVGVDGNISEPPLFVNPDFFDYHLQSTSPCIDAGDPAGVPPAPDHDLDGQERPQGSGVDLGADEAG